MTLRAHLLPMTPLSQTDLAVWQGFRARNAAFASPFYSADYAAIVAEFRRDVRLLLVEDAGRTVLFWPLQIDASGRARAIGAPLNDRHGPLFDLDWAAQTDLATQLATIQRHTRLNTIHFSALPEGFSGLSQFGLHKETNRSVVLPSDVAEYWASRTAQFPGHFKDMRRRRRAAERDVGVITLQTGPAAHAEALRLARDWKREQFARTSKHNVLAPKWVVGLTDRLVERACDAATVAAGGVRGEGLLLRLGDAIAAVEFNLREGHVLHSWMAAYDPAYRAYSPGMILIEEGLSFFATNGVGEVDIGISHDQYKKYYATDALDLIEGEIHSPSLGGHVHGVKAAVWRAIEQNAGVPRLAHLASRARRRLDQIFAVETEIAGRIGGVWQALFPARRVG